MLLFACFCNYLYFLVLFVVIKLSDTLHSILSRKVNEVVCGITTVKSINIPHTISPVSSALEILSVRVIMAWLIL